MPLPHRTSFTLPGTGSVFAVAGVVLALVAGCSRQEPAGVQALASTASAASIQVPPPLIASSVAASPASAPAEGGIAWRPATNDAEVDAAFAVARATNKPVFVYWGAKWCPPCNQVKATLFNRQDFIERSRAFVPVYIDGDSPGAQKLGARFHVSGYPTMVLFSPQGAELTRLPGEVEPERYTQVLTLGMNADRPVREVLAQALGAVHGAAGRAAGDVRAREVAGDRSREVAGDRSRNAPSDHAGAGRPAAPLRPSDWRLLGFYAWDVDEQQLVSKDRIAATLARLADACPPDEIEAATRLRLKAVAAADAPLPPAQAEAGRLALRALLADPAAARRTLDLLTNNAAEIVRGVSTAGTAARGELLAAFDTALKRFEADPTLARADRIGALIAQVDLARIDPPRDSKVPPVLTPALLADIRARTAAADREISDGYERQAVITACAYLLERAGLGAESDTLLKANLEKSHSPYYLMSQLAGNAKARGDHAEALHWYAEAFAKSEGPATRLQWGASYLAALVDLAPQDDARIAHTAQQLFDEAGRQPDAFYERSGRALQRVGAKLAAWNAGGRHAAAIAALQGQLDALCDKLPAGDSKRASCTGLLKAQA